MNADGSTVISDKGVKLWNTRTGLCEKTMNGGGKQVTFIAVSPDGQSIATASIDKVLKPYNIYIYIYIIYKNQKMNKYIYIYI